MLVLNWGSRDLGLSGSHTQGHGSDQSLGHQEIRHGCGDHAEHGKHRTGHVVDCASWRARLEFPEVWSGAPGDLGWSKAENQVG